MSVKQVATESRSRLIAGLNKTVLPKLLIGLAGLIFVPTSAFAVVENITPFEWAMPDRLLENTSIAGYDPATPIPEYDPNALMLPTGGWTVNFDACGVSTSTIVSYEWFVDGVSVATATNCQFSHQFPEEGVYHISLTVTDDVGDSAVLEETITVQDWLIVAMGDSYASGEGNPEIPVSAQAHVDFSVLFDLAENVRADLDAALAQLPGLEDAQAAAQQLRDDAQITLTEAQNEVNRLRTEHQGLFELQTNVENDPTVIAARNLVISRQQVVAQRQAEYSAALSSFNSAQSAVNNYCTTIIPTLACLGAQADLAAAELQLAGAVSLLGGAQTSLVAAEGSLLAARTAAVVIYSAFATIQNFTALANAINDANILINAAQNTVNLAQNAYNNAAAALQQTIDAVVSLQSIIDDFRTAWEQAKLNAQTQYLDHLPVWTSTPPSWGTPEPTYAEIVLGDQIPGEALRCHRSMISGQARAALALEQADPHTSVTFVHLSCTGATIAKGLNGTYTGADIGGVLDPLLSRAINTNDNLLNYQCLSDDEPPVPVPCAMATQLDAAVEKTLGREVDAMVISIGGNDVKFAKIIEDCILGQPCHEDLGILPSTEFDNALAESIAANCRPIELINSLTGLSLPVSTWFGFMDNCLARYDFIQRNVGGGAAMHTFNTYMYGGQIGDGAGNPVDITSLQTKMLGLNDAIETKFPTFDRQRVYITQYPDPTGDDMGNHCGWDPSQPPSGDGLKSIPGVTQPETAWAEITVATALREETRAAAGTHSWKFVSETGEGSDTIGTASRNHGYCADDHWIIRIPESLITQQDISGTMHPNRAGHEVYKKAIYNQLVADLYPAGVTEPPRPPEEPPVSNNPTPGGGGGSGGSMSWAALLVLSVIGLLRRRLRLKPVLSTRTFSPLC